MLKVKIIDVTEMYCGQEAFDNGEVAQITASVDNGEGGYVEIFSKKLNQSWRVYSGEYDAFEIYKDGEI